MRLLALAGSSNDSTAAAGWLPRIDPRLRIATALLGACCVTAVHTPLALGIAVFATLLAALGSGLSLAAFAGRMLPLNLLMAMLAVTLPLTTPGPAVWTLGPLAFSLEGLSLAGLIALKGNLLVVLMTALVGSIDETAFGHALSHLYVPEKLAHLMLFTVRYLDVLQHEYVRLRAAMKVRGFQPGMNRHTLRSLGYLCGMLLVRSFDRAERIVAAMKCRGFRGRFYLLDHFALGWRDAPFAVAAAGSMTAMIAAEWFSSLPTH